EAAALAAVTIPATGALLALLEVLGVQGTGGGAQGLGEHLALVDPHLHADAAVGGGSLGEAVVDVGAEGLQRDGAVVVVLHAGDLGAVQAAGDLGLDAQGTHAHGAAHGVLHGPAESDALL